MGCSAEVSPSPDSATSTPGETLQYCALSLPFRVCLVTLREGAPVIAKTVKIPETCLSGYLHQTPNKVNERIHPNRFEYSQGIGTKGWSDHHYAQ